MMRTTVLIAAAAVVGTLQAYAQERIYAGPVAGYEFSVPLLLQRNEGAINYEPGFPGSGVSYSHSVVAGAQLFAPKALSDIVGYSGRISLYATSANFTSDRFVPGIRLDTVTFEIEPDRYRQVSVDLTAATVVADIQARAAVGDVFDAGLGLWGSMRLSGQFMRTERPTIMPPD